MPYRNTIEFCSYVRVAAKERKISLTKLFDKAGVDRQNFYNKYEKGKARMTLETAANILDILEAS